MPRKTTSRAPVPANAATNPGGRAGDLLAPRWAKVERVRLIHREIRETLSPGAIDLLFTHGDLVVEGGDAVSTESGSGRVYATVMLTIELTRCADRVCEPADAATAERLAELMRDCESVRVKLAELARPHLARLANLAEDAIDLEIDPSVRSEKMRLLIDGDAAAWPRKRRR